MSFDRFFTILCTLYIYCV